MRILIVLILFVLIISCEVFNDKYTKEDLYGTWRDIDSDLQPGIILTFNDNDTVYRKYYSGYIDTFTYGFNAKDKTLVFYYKNYWFIPSSSHKVEFNESKKVLTLSNFKTNQDKKDNNTRFVKQSD